MSGSPSDFTEDEPLPTRSFNNQPRGNKSDFKIPQKLSPAPTVFRRNVASPTKPNTSFNNNNIHNRLGHRNFQRNNNGDGFNNNRNNGNQNRNNFNNFNRKRHSEGNEGPSAPKRRWNNKRQQHHQNNFAQNRLNRIRSQSDLSGHNFEDGRSLSNSNDSNDTQEIDATDITVEVINHNATAQQEESNLKRFKMVLDPKTQAAVRVIQSKRRDKQVIFPFPVTPNVTEISLHERFTML